MHRIVNDIHTGKTVLGEGPYLDDMVRRVVGEYEYLLAYEPLLSSLYDARYMYVAPIANTVRIDVNRDELYFLERVNAIYLNSGLTFTSFIGVTNE
jgi:hypothetical protein